VEDHILAVTIFLMHQEVPMVLKMAVNGVYRNVLQKKEIEVFRVYQEYRVKKVSEVFQAKKE